MDSETISDISTRQPSRADAWAIVLPNGIARGAFRTEEELEEIYQFRSTDIEYCEDEPVLKAIQEKSDRIRAFPCDLDFYEYFCLKNASPIPVLQNLSVTDLGRLCLSGGPNDAAIGRRRYRNISVNPGTYWYLKALAPASQVRFLESVLREYVAVHSHMFYDHRRLQLWEESLQTI